MKPSTSTGVVVFVGVFLWSGISAGKKLTNYEVLQAQVDTLSGSIVKILTAQRITSLSCRYGPGEADIFVRQKIEEQLLRNSFRLLSDSLALYRLRINTPVVQVAYSSPVASHIFASSDVERTIQSNFDIELSDSCEITVAKSYSFIFADTVNESEIQSLEAGSYNFLHGKVDSGGFLDTILQPILFIASGAVIVYLFFTLRGS